MMKKEFLASSRLTSALSCVRLRHRSNESGQIGHSHARFFIRRAPSTNLIRALSPLVASLLTFLFILRLRHVRVRRRFL